MVYQQPVRHLRLLHQFNNDCRRRDFRDRQCVLITTATVWITTALITGMDVMLAVAALELSCATTEAQRFLRTGQYAQTIGHVMVGASEHDERQRHLLREGFQDEYTRALTRQ